jgi:hypothetical protein
LRHSRQESCSKETANEELSRLRAELASSQKLLKGNDALLAAKDSVIAMKDELLASRAAGLQGCGKLMQQRDAEYCSVDTAAGSSKRKCLYENSASPLDRDDVLTDVFSFVGGGDHLYTGGVCRKRRGRYMQCCAQISSSEAVVANI